MLNTSNQLQQTTIMCMLLVMHMMTSMLSAQSSKLWPEAVEGLVEYDRTEFEIFNQRKAILRQQTLYHIYHSDKKGRGRVVVEESTFKSCRKISITLLDMNNKVIRKSSSDDIKKAEITPGYALYSDSKYQYIEEFSQAALPYKVLIETEVEYRSLFFWPDWYPQDDIPVLHASYKLILHEDIDYSVSASGLSPTPETGREGGKTVHLWKLNVLEPRLQEDFVSPDDRFQIKLIFKPNRFELAGNTGYSKSWDDFARWYAGLLAGRQSLPGDAILQIKQMLKPLSSDREKIAVLYRFLQDYTHYVAIHLGIGGWQPHSAESVFRNKYGDCKDLSILMVAMLEVAGIKAYPALARFKDSGLVDPDFPSNQFNHCIAAVPLPDDTLFVECTADYQAAEVAGRNLEGTHVLMITENGGELVRIPESPASSNRLATHVKGSLTSTGMLKLDGNSSASGNWAGYLRGNLAERKSEEATEWLERFVGRYFPRLSFDQVAVANIKDSLSLPVDIEFTTAISNAAATSGRRLFFNANLFSRITSDNIPDEAVDERRLPVFYFFANQRSDSVTVKIPLGYSLESSPKAQTLETPFGHYRTAFSFKGGKLTYFRELELTRTQIDTSEYGDYLAFLNQISKNDKAKFVFKR